MADTFRKDSPLDKASKAARDGDIDALQKQSTALKEGARRIEGALNDNDIVAASRAATDLGIQFGRLAEVIDAIAKAQAAISVVNLLVELGNKALLETASAVTYAFLSPEVEPPVVELTATIDKQNKGWVILDNTEGIEVLTVTVEELTGRQILSVNLTITVTAIGFGQDALTYALKPVENAQGTGPANALLDREQVDKYGLVAERTQTWYRSGFTTFALELAGSGVIEYGLNGANVAAVLEVGGIITMPNSQSFVLKPVKAASIGISI